MKTFAITLATLTTALLAADPVRACPRHTTPRPAPVNPTPRPVPPTPTPIPTPLPQRPTPPADASGATSVDWDLPADTSKSPESRPQTGAVSVTERLMQAGAARQALIEQTARLAAKKAELLRWDHEAQVKFQRAFGSTNPDLRDRMLTRIDQEIDRHQQAIVAMTENLSLELYLQTKRNR